jgi:hypothetical protein
MLISYDTFALRDVLGHKTATLRYPYFHQSSSLQALYKLEPIPVQSCWNGIISFEASPFYASPALEFRAVPDSLAAKHVEGSECCLIHSDNHQLRREKGVWLNPNVRVSYNASSYSYVNGGAEVKAAEPYHPQYSVGSEKEQPGQWPRKWERVVGIWANRYARVTGWGRLWSEAKLIKHRVSKWEREEQGREEKGLECLVNEMQVLFESGWKHV